MKMHYYFSCENLILRYKTKQKDKISCEYCGPEEYLGCFDNRIDVEGTYIDLCLEYSNMGMFDCYNSGSDYDFHTGNLEYDFIRVLDMKQRILELEDIGFRMVKIAPSPSD